MCMNRMGKTQNSVLVFIEVFVRLWYLGDACLCFMNTSCQSCTYSPASGTDGVFSESRSLSWVRGAVWLSPRAHRCLQSPCAWQHWKSAAHSLQTHLQRAGREQSLQEDKSAAEDKHKGAGLSPMLGQKSCPRCV